MANAPLLALAVLSTAVSTSPASAQMTGNDLLFTCSLPDQSNQAMCLGYVIGLSDGITWGSAWTVGAAGKTIGREDSQEVAKIMERFLRYCLPETVTAQQVRDVIVKYVTDNPDIRHENAKMLGHFALIEAFPCPAE